MSDGERTLPEAGSTTPIVAIPSIRVSRRRMSRADGPRLADGENR